MKTSEERKADREARLIANVSGPRTGYTPETAAAPPEPSPIVQGLKLSDVQLWPQERFKPHPSNHVFDSAKTEDYWRDLRRDILEAGAIINPVIALPDGTLLEGHSRLRIARELADEGQGPREDPRPRGRLSYHARGSRAPRFPGQSFPLRAGPGHPRGSLRKNLAGPHPGSESGEAFERQIRKLLQRLQ